MLRTILALIFISSSVLSTGCANKTIANQAQVEQSALEQAKEFSGDSERALAEAESKYDAALKADMKFYAPLHVEQAKEALKLAQTKELNADKTASLNASAKVLTLLNSAEINKKKVETLLAPLLAQKEVLEKLKTPRILSKEFKTQMDNMKDVIKEIEAGKEADALSKSDAILADLEALELNTLLAIHWKPAQKTLLKAEKENADDNAPKSFLVAVEAVQNAEHLIRTDYKDRPQVEQYGHTALRAAQHALYTARDAERLVRLNEKQAEAAVLRYQVLIAKIGKPLNSKDVSHMALGDQVNALAQIAETQERRLSATFKKQIAKLEAELNKQQAPAIVEEKEAPVAEKAPAIIEEKEAPVAEEAPAIVEEKEVPLAEETPAIVEEKEVPVIEEAPEAVEEKEAPVTEEAPAIVEEEAPAIVEEKEAPVIEEISITEEAPATE